MMTMMMCIRFMFDKFAINDESFPDYSAGKESACSSGDTEDPGLIPALGRSPGGGHGNLLQYSCLENPMDRGAWRSVVYGVAESWTEHTRTRSVDWGKRYLGFVSVSLLIQGKPALFNSARTFWGARKPYFRGVSNVKKHHPYFQTANDIKDEGGKPTQRKQ